MLVVAKRLSWGKKIVQEGGRIIGHISFAISHLLFFRAGGLQWQMTNVK
jgi:hypothetical protein